MDSIFFSIGQFDVTVAQALIAAALLIALTLLGLMIATFRNNGSRLEESARLATEGLRVSFIQQVADRDARIRTLEDQVHNHQQANTQLQAGSAALQARMNEQNRNATENIDRLQKARQEMTDQFKVIASDVLKSHGETFSKQNREQVDTLLKPLGEKIVEFQTGLAKDRAEMGERIRALTENSLRMTTEANNLTRALKGSSQIQGAWGEMILATILERSGLREGEQFVTQQTHAGDDGGRVRTDVEIFLPNGDSLIVDSKVSLTAFEAFANASEETERATSLRAHCNSMRNHIKTLSSKQYQRHANSGVDFVFMFVPIESAFSAALTADPDLLDYAIGLGVFMTTPTTLMSALRTVRNVWDTEKRHQNAEEIAERAGSLYDKVVGFLGNMEKIGQSLEKAQQSFGDAKSQLSTGRGSILRQIEMVRELGAKTSKQIPVPWTSGDDPSPLRQLAATAEEAEAQGAEEDMADK